MGILTQLEVDFDIEIVEDFISHYAIMCENMEPLIIGLNKKERYHENIGELFRIFHNTILLYILRVKTRMYQKNVRSDTLIYPEDDMLPSVQVHVP